jgi:peptidoglycan/xylan/chitin deacetylase (PgdA/CDA1 family)/GT2 family glycosyltransferase
VSGGRRTVRVHAHWVLLALVLVVVAIALTVTGLATQRTGAAGTDIATGTGVLPPGTGPVLVAGSADPAHVTSAQVRPGTVALTFDDGPDPQWTPQILQILRDRGVHATFFVVGARAALQPSLVRQILADGNEIGVHTFSHPDLATLSDAAVGDQLGLTQGVIAASTGITTHLLRPPYSSTTAAVTARDWPSLHEASSQGYAVVLSTQDTRDWSSPGVARIVADGIPPSGTGGIVLMHDGGGDRAETVAALPLLIDALRARGLTLGTVSETTGLSGAQEPASTGERVTGAAVLAVVWTSENLARLLALLLGVFLVLSLLRALLLVLFARRHVVTAARRPPPEAGPLPAVSVVVPAYNEQAGIAGTLRSLVATGYPGLEIVVVDDGSTDSTCDVVRSLDLPQVSLLQQPNSGKAAALRHGVAQATHDVLVLVDADTVFETDAIENLVRAMSDPAIGAVSGNTKVSNRGGLLGRWQHLEYVVGFNLDRRMFDVLDCITTVPGAIGAFRREALDAVGGVSSDTLAEDTDLTMAVTRAGWRVVYEQSAIAWTEAPSTLAQLWRQRYRWCYGTLQSMWKHRHAVVETGRAGHLGRRGLPYLLLFQVLMPMLGPVVDLMALYGLVFLDPVAVLVVAGLFLLVQVLLGAYALHLDHEPLRAVWALPLQQFVYRQLMYLVVIQSVVTALAGARLDWQPLQRRGSARVLTDP